MKRIILILALALVGCESTPLANRISMTLAGDDAYVNSMYGPLGITSKIDRRDAEILREMQKLRAMVEAVMRAEAQRQKAGI